MTVVPFFFFPKPLKLSKRNISEMNTELETLKENVKMVVSLYEMVSILMFFKF